jgi:hypothetical protein
LANELADTLDKEVSPHFPSALYFLDEEVAHDIVKCAPEKWPSFSEIEEEMGEELALTEEELAHSLLFEAIEEQEFSHMLRRLVSYIEDELYLGKRDTRPSVGNVNARNFARHMSEYFKSEHGTTPNGIIAACVRLKFPELDPPPGEDDIRQWRGAR